MGGEFTDYLEADDWRNAAAIVGLIRFFDYAQIPYNREEIEQAEEVYDDDAEYDEGLDFLKFNAADITEEKLDDFIEYCFAEELHHCVVERALDKTEWSKEEVDFINGRLTANTVMKKIFSKQKFDGTNKEEILDLIRENRTVILRETYRNKSNLYRNFCNENIFRKPEGETARLKGYYVDFAKKGKSLSYRYDTGLFGSSDSVYYDFILFAFTIGRESFFINDNSTIRQLVRTNRILRDKCREQRQMQGSADIRRVLFENIIYASDFIDFDVEIIRKNVDNPYFETFYLRRESIAIFRKIKNYTMFCRVVKLDEGYIQIQEEVTNAVSNLQLMDGLIEALVKKDVNEKASNYCTLVWNILQLNLLIRSQLNIGGENMNKNMRSAYACAEKATAELRRRNQKNKINSYQTKLLSALIFHDYNRFSEILLSLSNYTDVYFPFAYDLFEDFEANKEAAYTFVNNFNEYAKGRTGDEETDNRTMDEV